MGDCGFTALQVVLVLPKYTLMLLAPPALRTTTSKVYALTAALLQFIAKKEFAASAGTGDSGVSQPGSALAPEAPASAAAASSTRKHEEGGIFLWRRTRVRGFPPTNSAFFRVST